MRYWGSSRPGPPGRPRTERLAAHAPATCSPAAMFMRGTRKVHRRSAQGTCQLHWRSESGGCRALCQRSVARRDPSLSAMARRAAWDPWLAAPVTDRVGRKCHSGLIGLDLSVSMFAPCLLVCRGTPQQRPLRAGAAVARRPTCASTADERVLTSLMACAAVSSLSVATLQATRHGRSELRSCDPVT